MADPTFANREVLPLSSGGKLILPGQTAAITARPQRSAFRPERLFISNSSPVQVIAPASTPPIKIPWWQRIFGGGSARMLRAEMARLRAETLALRDEIALLRVPRGACEWEVVDITIGNRSQFAQSGSVPGDMFGTQAIDSFLIFETAQVAMDVTVIVTYRGPVREGAPFCASMIGQAVPWHTETDDDSGSKIAAS